MAEETAYPIAQYNFEVAWGDTSIICSEVSGLSSTIEVMEYTDAKTQAGTAQRGLQSFDDVVFTKAVFESNVEFESWYKRVVTREAGFGETVTITLKNEVLEPVFTWELQGAHVRLWETPELNSQASEIALEKLTIVVENIVTVIGA